MCEWFPTPDDLDRASRPLPLQHRPRQIESGYFSSASGRRDLIDTSGPMGLPCLHPSLHGPDDCWFEGCVCVCHETG